MDPTQITMINDLGLSNDNYTIKVRIIQLWKQTTWSKPHETRQIGMILMDEEGNKIECTVEKQYVILGKALEEYADVYIHQPTLGLYVDDAMKFVDIKNKLFFQYTTRVNKCIGFNGPLNSFAFANFQDVIDKAIPSTISFDVISNVFQCYPLEPATQKLDKRITLKLEDLEGRQVLATLWGDYAEQIDSYVSKQRVNFVMIIQCARWKDYRGRVYVNNTYLATKLFIDEQVEEIIDLKKKFNEKESGSVSSCSRATTSSMMYIVHDDFQISMIHELDEGSYAIILGTINIFKDNQEWYYPTCKNRKRKVHKMPIDQENLLDHVAENESWVCTQQKCKNQVIVAEPSFMLKIRVQGLVGVVTLTLFDRDVRSILNISASDLIEKYEKMDDTVAFPVEINELIGRKMAFKIIVRGFTAGRKYIRSYNILKISDDVDIISALEKLEKANHIEQDTETESVNVVVSDFNSQDTIGFKGSASFVADNTPISTFPNTISMTPSTNHDTTSLLSPTTNVKRKLVDVYDLEDTVCQSSTKPSKKSIGIKETVVSTQLLIPKVEK
ncbi:unnamed protein product [Lactuca saligna]|uniref:Replication protein A subunit n=1 Tax=Lactuca saligna TaxID=75948 RepID=A0AA35ZCE9_LACSI|nr:unnamed protein product [Lactuca saligna]